MKVFILGLLFAASTTVFAATHPASEFVHTTLTKALKILELKSDEARVRQMCSIFKKTMALDHVGSAWLGRYAGLERDQAGVRKFRQMMPSIMVTQLYPALGVVEGGSFVVDPGAQDLGNGRCQVGVKVRTADGHTYNAKGKIGTYSGKMRLMDVTAMGISAVGYIGRDFKQRFDDEYNQDPANSLPVSVVLEQIQNSADYLSCP